MDALGTASGIPGAVFCPQRGQANRAPGWWVSLRVHFARYRSVTVPCARLAVFVAYLRRSVRSVIVLFTLRKWCNLMAPLCKGGCRPNRPTGGLPRRSFVPRNLGGNPSVTAYAVPPPFTQGRLCAASPLSSPVLPPCPSACSTSYTSCRCRRGRDRWDPPSCRTCGQAAS